MPLLVSLKCFYSFLDTHIFSFSCPGHQNLWKKGILHRDISINNILLGNRGAKPGNRGLVIDLDMGIWINRTTSLAGADFRTVRVLVLDLLNYCNF